MFDSDNVFNKVMEPDELEDKFTIIQCCTDDRYRPILQKICEYTSLTTYEKKMLNAINTME